MKSIDEINTDQDFNELWAECMGYELCAEHDKCDVCFIDNEDESTANIIGDPVNNMSRCWALIEKVGVPVGKWDGTDGYFHLMYAEFAEHIDNDCSINEDKWHDDENKTDLTPWSAHLHIGSIGDNIHVNVPEHWKHNDEFCSRGASPQKAIILACALALGKVKE